MIDPIRAQAVRDPKPFHGPRVPWALGRIQLVCFLALFVLLPLGNKVLGGKLFWLDFATVGGLMVAGSAIAFLNLWDSVRRYQRMYAYQRWRNSRRPRWRRGTYPRFMQNVWFLRVAEALSVLIGLLWVVVGLQIALR